MFLFPGTFGFWSQPVSHGRMSIIEFIERAMEFSRNGKFLYFLRPHAPGHPPSPVALLYPISRFEVMQSLQHTCRFVILKHVRYDHIEQLPLPGPMKRYLKEKQYFTEKLDNESDED
jgi:suppressor of cytokine signaling 7